MNSVLHTPKAIYLCFCRSGSWRWEWPRANEETSFLPVLSPTTIEPISSKGFIWWWCHSFQRRWSQFVAFGGRCLLWHGDSQSFGMCQDSRWKWWWWRWISMYSLHKRAKRETDGSSTSWLVSWFMVFLFSLYLFSFTRWRGGLTTSLFFAYGLKVDVEGPKMQDYYGVG